MGNNEFMDHGKSVPCPAPYMRLTILPLVPALSALLQVVVEIEKETVAGWTSIAAGLAHLAHGVAAAVEQEQCGPGDVAAVVERTFLKDLFSVCPNDASRCSNAGSTGSCLPAN